MVDNALIDWQTGAPRSLQFDDIYFSPQDGLAESRAVFLDGCGLPEAWSGKDRFVVGELGFGTGLNILALLQLWSERRPPGARLQIFSVEAFPMTAADAARALAAFPELEALAAPLLSSWPTARGYHRLELPGLCATLDLAVLEAAEALAEWRGRADAWFLDGFAPSRNPQMWRQEVLDLLASKSALGARAASFTVAGAVRRGLAAAGFSAVKKPGFGAKAERLEAVYESPVAGQGRDPGRVAIVGAGVAGAALARAFAAEGVRALVIDAVGPGAGASGNPAALVTPRLDAGGGPSARLHAQAFARAADLYRRETPEAVIAQGALQLEAAERDRGRFDRLAESELFEPGALQRLDASAAGAALGEPLDDGALLITGGLVLEPAAVLARWLAKAQAKTATIGAIVREGSCWRLLDEEGRLVAEAETLCLAGGFGASSLTPHAPLQAVRGQASMVRGPGRPAAAAWGGYIIPTRDGLLFGATHDRDQSSVEVRPEDHARNLATLARRRPRLAAALRDAPWEGRAGVRATTRDRAPLAGSAGVEGLYLLAGLGGRGFALAPLLAEHICAEALGAPSPLPASLADVVDPQRFSHGSATA